jgi:hypothetical protein
MTPTVGSALLALAVVATIIPVIPGVDMALVTPADTKRSTV